MSILGEFEFDSPYWDEISQSGEINVFWVGLFLLLYKNVP